MNECNNRKQGAKFLARGLLSGGFAGGDGPKCWQGALGARPGGLCLRCHAGGARDHFQNGPSALPGESLPAAQPSKFVHAAHPSESVPFLRADRHSKSLRADRPSEFLTPRTREFPRTYVRGSAQRIPGSSAPANSSQQLSPENSCPLSTSKPLPAAQPCTSCTRGPSQRSTHQQNLDNQQLR